MVKRQYLVLQNYGLEADLFEALPQFLEELNKLNSIQK